MVEVDQKIRRSDVRMIAGQDKRVPVDVFGCQLSGCNGEPSSIASRSRLRLTTDNGQLPSPTFATMEHDDARDRMRKALDLVHKWPAVYMFKFIFEPEEERLNAVLALFPPEAEILRKYSKAGKYLSVTAREVMLSADEVVARYDKAALIEGVIVL